MGSEVRECADASPLEAQCLVRPGAGRFAERGGFPRAKCRGIEMGSHELFLLTQERPLVRPRDGLASVVRPPQRRFHSDREPIARAAFRRPIHKMGMDPENANGSSKKSLRSPLFAELMVNLDI
jgi:hypothetical protein